MRKLGIAVAAVCFVASACGGDSGGSGRDGAVGDASSTTEDTGVPADASTAPDGAVPTCTPRSGTAITLQLVDGFTEPVLATGPRGDARLFVLERRGRIKIVKDGTTLAAPFLDIRTLVHSTDFNEMGLLGLAFHPGFATNGRFFVYYTEDIAGGAPYRSVVAEYGVTPGGDVANTTERRLLTLEQPAVNHNGGMMQFSPNDGYLYIGLGDGGADGTTAQDTSSLLGSMLRIDVDGAAPYQVPADNPFVGTAGRDEIWTYGWRNPWRWSFDRATGDMYVGDVGDSVSEEVSVHPASMAGGGNFGWPLCEGDIDGTGSCGAAGLIAPVAVRDHGNGRCSMIGGYVYRGSCMPDLAGWYIYSDFCSGEMWKFEYSGGVATSEADLTSQIGGGYISSLGQDGLGEMYVVSWGAGTVSKIVLQ